MVHRRAIEPIKDSPDEGRSGAPLFEPIVNAFNVEYYTWFHFHIHVLAFLPVFHIGPSPHSK